MKAVHSTVLWHGRHWQLEGILRRLILSRNQLVQLRPDFVAIQDTSTVFVT